MYNKMKKKIAVLLIAIMMFNTTACAPNFDFLKSESEVVLESADIYEREDYNIEKNKTYTEDEVENPYMYEQILTRDVYIDFKSPYATYSIINSGHSVLYMLNPYYKGDKGNYATPNNITVAVNAGHGTEGGTKIKTFAHPDYSPRVTSGTNAAGDILSYAVSAGTTLANNLSEAEANLMVARRLKEKLLLAGYNVLMIRDAEDVQLDNIARTVIANTFADCHIAIHFNSTETDIGVFYITPYKNQTYLNMEPLKSNYNKIITFGNSVISAFKSLGVKTFKESGTLQGDLTQLSFSTNPSIDIELGDKATKLNDEKIEILTEGMKLGIDKYFGR